MHAYTCQCIPACMHTCVHICLRVCVLACIRASVHVYLYACMPACMNIFVHVYQRACILCACAHECLYTCMHAYMCACIPAFMRARVHVYLLACKVYIFVTFDVFAGATICTSCFSLSNSSSCTPCGPGTASGIRQSGATWCMQCKAGTFSDHVANSVCIACAP